MDRIDILYFGDQSHEIGRFFQDALQVSSQSNLVGDFLDKVDAALSAEVTRLSRRQREEVPQFTTVEDLGRQWIERKNASIVAAAVLLTTAQFIDLLGFCETQALDQTVPKDTYVVGLCTGQLVAATVACADNITRLVPLAVEAVRIAFRLGVHVAEIASTLHLTCIGRESWAHSFRGIGQDQAESILKEFHQENKTHTLAQAYISAITLNSITISGPPPTLAALIDSSSVLKSTSHGPLPIYGPYHAGHLFQTSDFASILSNVSPRHFNDLGSRLCLYPLLSTKSGKPIQARTFYAVLKEVLEDVLRNPLRLDLVTQKLVTSVRESNASCRLAAIGPAHVGNALTLAIQNGSDAKVSTEDFEFRWPASITEAYNISRRESAPGVAIIGYSGRFPGADNAEALWDVLAQGLDLHREIPIDRFNPETHVDPSGKKRNTSHTPFGCFIDNPGQFDPSWFNMSPREAKQTDPMQRLFLMTAYEALEMSGYVRNRTPSTRAARIGTICGQTSDDYREVNAGHHVGTYFTTGTIRAFGPGRINYYFKLDGPSYNVDTACSSSLAAIQLACSAITRGEADTFIAGGVNVMTAPDQYAGLSRGQFLSKTGPCKTFDNEADGYCRGESIGTVILKRLDQAKADKDKIYGIIRSAATNHSADAVSITHPHAPTQETLYRSIAREARLSPLDIDYIEMHGTGTQAGDNIEMTSVSNVFAPELTPRQADHPLYVGSVKANVGHGEAASGVTALIKCLLMFRHDAIPPHVGIKGTMNESFPDLNARNIQIPTELTPFHGQPGRERRILVNNFSAAGGNTALILEEHWDKRPSTNDPRKTHVIAVSARNPNLLRSTTERLLSHLDKNPETSLSSLSYTTTARRPHGRLRWAIVADSIDQVKQNLPKKLELSDADIKKVRPVKEVAFAFTGQGAMYTSMGKDFLETVKSFRVDIEKFDTIGQRHGFPSFLAVLDGTVDDVKNLSTVQTQLGLVCTQIAMARMYRNWGVSASLLIGHSLGEYAALHMAGILSISDTIYLVGTRAALLQEHCTPGTHEMLAVKSSVSDIEKHLSEKQLPYEVACRNAPEETVLSGSQENIASAADELSKQGLKCTKVALPYAFHSAQVDVILEKFEKAAANVVFSKAVVAMICPTLETVIDVGESVDAKYLCKHARDPVNFMAGLENAHQQSKFNEETMWVELGPHPLCAGMIRSTLGSGHEVFASMRRDQNVWQTSATSLSALHCRGFPVDWSEYHRHFEDAVELLELPRPAWELDDYWLPYQNDWTLTKGDPIVEDDNELEDELGWKPTTTMHSIVFESFGDDVAEVVFESDMHEPLLREIVMGHLVNGAGLVPSSIYADMAMTAADYIHGCLRPHSNLAMDVGDMSVSRPVILSTSTDAKQPFLLNIRAKADLKAGEVRIRFTTGEEKSPKLHATCCVRFDDISKWASTLSRTSHLIERRVKDLDNGLNQGTSQKLRQRMVYKLFGALVTYGDAFRGMQDVILGDSGFEGVSNVTFQTTEDNGHFLCSPYWIDSIVHLSGFVLNANDSTDSDKFVFISHGWESMKFLETMQQHKSYRVYVSMVPEKGTTMMVGDVYAFDESFLVGFVGGVRFQKIPRKQLNMLLPPGKSAEKPKSASSLSQSRTPKSSAAPTPHRSPRQSVSRPSKSPVDPRTPARRTSQGLSPSVKTPRGSTSATPLASPRQSVNPSSRLSRGSISVSPKSSPRQSVSEPSDKADVQAVFDVIADEVGIDKSELQDDREFSELGVDSLLALSILGRLKEDGMDLPESLFSDYPTVRQLVKFLGGSQSAATPRSAEPPSQGSPSRTATTSSRPTTRDTSPSSSATEPRTGQTTPTSSYSPQRQTPRATSAPRTTSVADLLRPIIAEEMGIDEKKLADDSELSDLGMDSLMALSVISRLREETDLNPSDDLFAENTVLGDAERALGAGRKLTPSSSPDGADRESLDQSDFERGRPTKAESPSRPVKAECARSSKPAQSPESAESSKTARSSNSAHTLESARSAASAKSPEPTRHHASSVLMQGGGSGSTRTLFLLPDGSGSATSYKALPSISPGLKVYGLNCPYLRDAQKFTCGFEGVASMYIDEIKRRQPHGPYILGGWSAGGVIAYEITRQLLEAGETVDHLVLIDAPCPLTVPPMPGSLIDFFSKIGLFSSDSKKSAPPQWLLDHFGASVSNLKQYEPKPLGSDNLPQTTVIWGQYGVSRDLDEKPDIDGDTSSKHWILEDRTDFGGNGWEKLIDDGMLHGFPIPGNHFSIMKEPYVGELVNILRDAL